MDFINGNPDELNVQRKKIENEIAALSRQVDEMDGKIRAYLSDRQRNPHPRHQELIDRIQGYHINQSISNKTIATLVDNLQWKVHYSKRAWKQLWENAEAQWRKQNKPGSTVVFKEPIKATTEVETEHSKSQYSVNTLWEIQKEKLKMYGHSDSKESKADFKRRMKVEYEQLSKDKGQGQEIVMSFDKKSKHCKLTLK